MACGLLGEYTSLAKCEKRELPAVIGRGAYCPFESLDAYGRPAGQERRTGGVYGYESCNDNGCLDCFNVSKLLSCREL